MAETFEGIKKGADIKEHDRVKAREKKAKEDIAKGKKVVKETERELQVQSGRTVKNKHYKITKLASGTIKCRLAKVDKLK